jgi:hypothetical protein
MTLPLFIVILLLVWAGLMQSLFVSLRNRHPLTYESLGSPNLFVANHGASRQAFAGFLFGFKWLSLKDRKVSLISALLCAFVAVLALFSGYALLTVLGLI